MSDCYSFTKGYVHYNWLVLLSVDAQPAINNVGLFSILSQMSVTLFSDMTVNMC